MQKESLGLAEGLARWKAAQEPLISLWLKMVNQIVAGDVGDYALYQVAIRELMELVRSTRHHVNAEEFG